MPPSKASSWTRLVHNSGLGVVSRRAAITKGIAEVEFALGLQLPDALRELLLEADGVTDQHGAEVIWPVAEIGRQNQHFRSYEAFRSLYMPFENLLFVGVDGGGDQFAFPIQADGKIHNSDVFRWEHESDARSWYAGNLETYLQKRLASHAD